ncbi:MAG: peptide ABC transporter substrate-binding protein [Pseudomonadales bacterium]|jgi:oligopeptide transport system substrate-binding protein|nr:peptide ABC transporter substrate-binding protein [Pseudomonadales bacterium]
MRRAIASLLHTLRCYPQRCLVSLLLLICALPALAQNGVDYATQTVRIALTGEPRNLNSIRATDQFSIFFLEHSMEGLLRRDAHFELVGGVAERWEMEGTTARFWLRHDALWSDGVAVTAQDFVFAWRQVVNPDVASEYASIMYPVKNAEAINQGKLPLEALGVTALDDYTLEVQLEAPTGYFLTLMSFMVYYPVREDFYLAQNGRYFADVKNMIFNGPFKITSWVHGASLRMEKNLTYWDAANITLNVIDIPYITNDSRARFNLLKEGKLAIENGLQGLEAEQLRDALANRMRIRSHSDGGLFYIEFNHRPERITHNMNLRKAMQAVLDSQELVYKAIGIAGYIPGQSLIPTYMNGVHDKFRVEYPVQMAPLDPVKAREYLALAKQELGIDKIPPIAILCDDREVAIVAAQYLQSLFKRTLDLDIKVDVQTFKLRLDKAHNGSFDMAVYAWAPDYDDPITFADLFASWNANNNGRYSNPVYDAYVRTVQGTDNQQIRMDAIGKIQQLVIDEAIILPLYERTANTVQDPRLEGVVFSQLGAGMSLTYARVVQ